MIKLNRNKVLCLDWDKRSLRIVVARIGKGRIVLEDAHSHRLPEDVDAESPESMGEFIRGMLRRHRLNHRSVVLDVPRERAVINRLTLPPTPANEVAAAVRFQAMKELPFPIDLAALDYVVTDRDDKGQATEVLIAAVTLETLDRVRATCEAAGLTPARIGLRPYANVVSVRHMENMDDDHLLFVDVGPGATEIDVVYRDSLAFSRSANVTVPMPGRVEADTNTGAEGISIAQIAELDQSDAEVESAVEELLVEVTRTLQAYRATESDARIDRVVLAGGTGIEKQLAGRLETRLGYAVTLYDPSTSLGIDSVEAPKLRSFSATLGLAWGLSREGLLALDFLNPKRPVSRAEILRKRTRIGVLAATVVLVAAGGTLTKLFMDKRATLETLESVNKDLGKQRREKVEILNSIEVAEEWATDAVWPEHLRRIAELAVPEGAKPGEDLVVQEVVMDIVSRSPGITLRNVYAKDWQVPMDFVERLNTVEVDGDRLYEASQGTWGEVRDGLKWKGKVDIRIDLPELREFKEGKKDRERDRKKRLGRGK